MANERYLGLEKEAAYGSILAASDWADIISGGFKEDNQFQIPETGRGYDQFHAMLGGYKADGKAEGYLSTETIGLILESILGTSTPAGAADPYTHTFLSNLPGNPLSMYIGDLVVAGEQKVTSAICTKFELECVAGEIVTWSADFFAKQVEQSALQAPSFDTLDPIVFHEGDLKVGGGSISAYANAVKLTIERDAPADGYGLNDRMLVRPYFGSVKVSWEMDLYFDRLDDWKRFYDGNVGTAPGTTYTPFVTDLDLIRTAVTDALMIECDKTVYTTREANVDRRSRTMEKVEGRSIHDVTNTAALKATLYNAIATY